MTDLPPLLRQDRDGVATLTLNRPGSRNALSMELMEALDSALVAIAADSAIHVVVMAAAGAAFCAGHDMREMRATPTREAYEAVFSLCCRLM